MNVISYKNFIDCQTSDKLGNSINVYSDNGMCGGAFVIMKIYKKKKIFYLSR